MSRKTFLDAAAEAARTERPTMPWSRGVRRALMIARRDDEGTPVAAAAG